MRRRDLILATLVLLVAWQLLAWLLHVAVLPGPWTVIQAFVRAVPEGLARHFLVSGWRVVASIVLAMLLCSVTSAAAEVNRGTIAPSYHGNAWL